MRLPHLFGAVLVDHSHQMALFVLVLHLLHQLPHLLLFLLSLLV